MTEATQQQQQQLDCQLLLLLLLRLQNYVQATTGWFDEANDALKVAKKASSHIQQHIYKMDFFSPSGEKSERNIYDISSSSFFLFFSFPILDLCPFSSLYNSVVAFKRLPLAQHRII